MMAKMKHIYQMMQTGEFDHFKAAYKAAESIKTPIFKYRDEQIETSYARYVIQFGETFLKDLNDDNIRDAQSEHLS